MGKEQNPRRVAENEAFAKVVDFFAHKGIVVNTTSVLGFTTLSTLARLRPIRPRSLRFVHEQAEIDAWLDERWGEINSWVTTHLRATHPDPS